MSGRGRAVSILDAEVLAELDEVAAGSPHGGLAALLQARFYGEHELGCACRPVELREDHGLRCARCDALVVRRTRGSR